MEWSVNVSSNLESLLLFAVRRNLIEAVDVPYYRNLLMAQFNMDAPEEVEAVDLGEETATKLLENLCNLACEKGIIGDMQYERDLFSAKLM